MYPMAETIGERLRRLRESSGLSVLALARVAGIGENAVRKIESGDSKQPSFTTGVRIAKALGVSPWELAGEREPLQSGSYEEGASTLLDDHRGSIEGRLAELRRQILEIGETAQEALALAQTREAPPVPSRRKRGAA
jgi:transcriptional regulator with XRE-family HTH domain